MLGLAGGYHGVWDMGGYGRHWECGKDPFFFAQRLFHGDPPRVVEPQALKSSLTAAGGYKTLSKDPRPSLGS